METLKNIKTWLILLTILSGITACDSGTNIENKNATNKKTGVLLVNHGSRSETWRNALLNLEKEIKDSILILPNIGGIKTAFMEYNEPSIATQMKAFDKEGFTDIILVPTFLTVSSHSFDDIPTIIGQKEDPQSKEMCTLEKIECYTPKAKIHITPLLDFTDILQKNILLRYNALSKDISKEGLVMIAYGDVTYNTEWSNLLEKVGNYVKENTGAEIFSYGWCGHIAHYNPDSTTVAINRVLKTKKNAVVIPVLVAHDEMFQVKIIGDGIAKIAKNKERVHYKPDAILPDVNVNQWIINAVKTELKKQYP